MNSRLALYSRTMRQDKAPSQTSRNSRDSQARLSGVGPRVYPGLMRETFGTPGRRAESTCTGRAAVRSAAMPPPSDESAVIGLTG